MKKSVLFVGQAYYNSWFLSRELRHLGWKSDLLNNDLVPANQKYYWGKDFELPVNFTERLELFLNSFVTYDIFQFANKGGINFLQRGSTHLRPFRLALGKFFLSIVLFLFEQVFHSKPERLLSFLVFLNIGHFDAAEEFRFSIRTKFFSKILAWMFSALPANAEIYLLKQAGKKIVYTNNGCNDGVTSASFNRWGKVCESVCVWYQTDVCKDSETKIWGEFRNSVTDFQILSGGNRADYNLTPKAHEVPQFYCLDPEIWKPQLEIPAQYKLNIPSDVFKIFHSVGNYNSRTKNGVNIKCTHIYLPLIEELKAQGRKVELVFCHDKTIQEVRYVMGQCDLVVDMLTYGWFGANIREAMMLGIPSVCFIRPEWLADVAKEIPDYAKELPVISATPENIKKTLVELMENREKLKSIGEASRKFALKWHSAEVAAKKFDEIYNDLLRH